MKKFLAVLAACVLCAGSARALPYSNSELKQLAQGAPALASDQQAVVLHRDEAWAKDSGGRAYRQVGLVVLAKPDMPSDWLNADLITPDGGKLEMEQACWSDEGALTVTNLTYREGRDTVRVDWPSWQGAPRLLVLRYRQYFRPSKPVGGAYQVRLPYPVQEESLRIRLEGNEELYFYSSDNREPVVREEGKNLWYGWLDQNQPARGQAGGLVSGADPFVVFSLESGSGDPQLTMERIAAAPAGGPKIVSKPGVSQAALFAELNKLTEKLPKGSDGLYRNSALWAEPATGWETMAVINGALKQAGYTTRMWFHSLVPLAKEMPNTAFALYSPVIEIIEKGDKGWFWVPGETGSDGAIPEWMNGQTLYEQRGEKLIERTFSAGKVAENRFSADWKLQTDEQGNLTGTVTVTVKKAWLRALPGGVLSLDGLPGLQDWVVDKGTAEKDDGTFKSLTFKVSRRSGVPAPQGLMLRLPSLRVALVENLRTYNGEVHLAFPFVLEQSYTVDLPKGYKPQVLPGSGEAGNPQTTYSAYSRYNKLKNRLEADEKLIVRPTTVMAADSEEFRGLLATWGLWERNGLPLLK